MKALVFDLDDTLYAERTYAYSGFVAVATSFAKPLGDPAVSAAIMRGLFDSAHRPRVFNEILKQQNLSGEAQLLADMIDTFRKHPPHISLLADADAALTRFKPTHKLGIITDGPTVQQSAKVKALRLTGRVDEIILTDELGQGFGKPHPKAFETIAKRLGMAHDECAYIADNLAKDFVAPNALGWTTVHIVRADGIYRDAPVADGGVPQHVIESLDELDTLLP